MKVLGTGIYAPGAPISNDELQQLAEIEFDGARIERKLGIRSRHIAHLRGMDETTADFAEKASRRALESAEIDAEEIDLIVVGTDTPEYISPATSMILQGRLQKGQKECGAFDLGASCSSFVSALDTAARLLETDPGLRYALVVGVYNMPAYFRPGDIFGYSIFADGAGAWILERETGASSRYIGGYRITDGTQWDYVGVYSGGTRQAVTTERLEKGEYGLQLLQRLPGDRNVKLWPEVLEGLMEKYGRKGQLPDHILFTQINRSVIMEVLSLIGMTEEQTTMVMDRYGYTGSACIPMAFHHGVLESRIRRGDTVALIASGAGLAVSSTLFVY